MGAPRKGLSRLPRSDYYYQGNDNQRTQKKYSLQRYGERRWKDPKRKSPRMAVAEAVGERGGEIGKKATKLENLCTRCSLKMARQIVSNEAQRESPKCLGRRVTMCPHGNCETAGKKSCPDRGSATASREHYPQEKEYLLSVGSVVRKSVPESKGKNTSRSAS